MYIAKRLRIFLLVKSIVRIFKKEKRISPFEKPRNKKNLKKNKCFLN